MEIFIIMGLAVGAMWLMTSRTRKQQKSAADFRASLGPGQEVMTGSGMFGTIVAVEDDVITLETSPGVTTRWLRPAIAKLVEPPVVADGGDDDEDEYDEDEYDDEYDEYDDETDVDDEDDVVDETDEELDAVVDTEDASIDEVQIPDDASSLTTDPGEDEGPRR